MRKLPISKTEGAVEIVERILGEEDADLALVIPRGSVLGNSVNNFHLIKREADSAGKTVAIESVDENILAFAKASDIKAAHPLFSAEGSPRWSRGEAGGGARRRGAFSDIVPQDGNRSEARAMKTPQKRSGKAEIGAPASPARLPAGQAGGPTAERVGKKPKVHIGPRYAMEEQTEVLEPQMTGKPEEQERRERTELRGSALPKFRLRLPRRRIWAVVVIVIVIVSGAWLLSGPLARATITINFEKVPWQKASVVLADTAVSGINFERGILPAELFTTTKNLTHLFPASREEEVSEKAKGKIWIYNAFSSAPQVLVATTRFETPDGKIFRITKQVTVPGAVIKDGKITPNGIEADTIADKAGEAYNIGPIPRLSVPGFKGTPRYDGFYGEIKAPAKGGFIGKRNVPTVEDIKNARARMEELLRSGLEVAFLAGYPKEFKVLDGASKTDVTRLNVDSSTDEKGNFSIFGEARIRVVGFRESDLRSLLEMAAQKMENGTVLKELEFSYTTIKPDFEKGTLSFSLGAKGLLWPKFSPDEFENSILGKKVDEARSLVAALPRFAGGKVAVWPIWLGSVPRDPGKVKVVVE